MGPLLYELLWQNCCGKKQNLYIHCPRAVDWPLFSGSQGSFLGASWRKCKMYLFQLAFECARLSLGHSTLSFFLYSVRLFFKLLGRFFPLYFIFVQGELHWVQKRWLISELIHFADFSLVVMACNGPAHVHHAFHRLNGNL